MLRLLIVSPDSVLYQDGRCNRARLSEMASLVSELARHGVSTALWSNNRSTVAGIPLENLFSREAGVEVAFFQANAAGLPPKGARNGVAPILGVYKVASCEAALVGSKPSDLQAATNNRLLLLRPSWYEARTDYGLNMDTVAELRRFCLTFGLRKHPVYWRLDTPDLTYAAMGPYSTYIKQYANFGHDARKAAKLGQGTPAFWMLAVVSTLYFAELVQDVNYICAFPGHDPDTPAHIRPLVDETLVVLGQSLKVGYYGDLIIRHSRARKSQTSGDARTFANQLNTLELNRRPRRNRSATPNRSNLDLRGKKVLVVDDFCTTGHSLDASRSLIEAAGGQAVLFSWLKTINTDFVHMTQDPPLNPYGPNAIAGEPPSKRFGYGSHILDPRAPGELDSMLRTYLNWRP